MAKKCDFCDFILNLSRRERKNLGQLQIFAGKQHDLNFSIDAVFCFENLFRRIRVRWHDDNLFHHNSPDPPSCGNLTPLMTILTTLSQNNLPLQLAIPFKPNPQHMFSPTLEETLDFNPSYLRAIYH